MPVSEHVRALLGGGGSDAARATPRRDDGRAGRGLREPGAPRPPAVDAGARTALEQLGGQGLTLGMVSNIMRTPGACSGRSSTGSGLLAPFKVLTFSDECGIRKPDPEIFRLTLAQIGVRPEEAVHVGDDPVLDVEGARDAGMAGSSRSRPTGGPPARSSRTRSSPGLRELPAALDRPRLVSLLRASPEAGAAGST